MHKPITSIFSLLLLITTISMTSTVNSQSGRMVGTKTDIKDVKTNKEVQDLGRFSVEEYSRSILDVAPTSSPVHGGGHGGAQGPLVFVEVVEAQKQVVAGVKYYLKVAAMEDGVSRSFDAVVVVKPWVHDQFKQLLYFGPTSPNY